MRSSAVVRRCLPVTSLALFVACSSPAQHMTAGVPDLAMTPVATDGGTGGGTPPVDAGPPPPPNPIVDGPVRFTVLRDGLVRVEYAADQQFLDAPSFIAVDRTPAAGLAFTTDVVDGWRRVTTAHGTVRYRLGSGRFAADNLVLDTTHDGQPLSATPHFGGNTCLLGHTCEAEDGVTVGGTGGGGPTINDDHSGYTGAGFTQTWDAGSSLTWRLADLPAGTSFDLTVRYANASGKSVNLAYTLDDGSQGTLALPALANWDSWSTVTASVDATRPVTTLHLICPTGGDCAINVDNIAIAAHGKSAAPAPARDTSFLGGWLRGLDQSSGAFAMHPGLLSTNGWALVDDSSSALFNGTKVPLARPHADPDHQDGYLFFYDRDYKQALSDLSALTGPASLPPRWAFGILYCRYYAFHDSDWQKTIVPTAHTNQVPLDAIILDTDFKGPAQWNGWGYNPTYYPDPGAFNSWVQGQGLQLLFNVHPSIQDDDPDYPAAKATAGSLIATGNGRMAFDLSRQGDVDAFLALGVNHTNLSLGFAPWLDWCCDEVVMSLGGTPEDSWFATLYANELIAHGHRGKTWGRIGSRLTYYADDRAYGEVGPWSDHRNAIHFTGDTFPTWDTMAFEAQFTAAEASIGMPWVSHDIGSFHGNHLDDDMYVRWLQLATFQPIFRLHSDHGDRLPWEYDAAAAAPAAQLMRLREAMLPYTYTTAQQAMVTGVAMARPLWLEYPGDQPAYAQPTEYLWGDSLLVAPVTKAGTTNVQTDVYLPPGRWLGFVETGMKATSYAGPTTVSVTTDLSSMPVFARAGAIIPMQPYADRGGALVPASFTVDVFAGANGSFALYEDGGDGLDYQTGVSASTRLALDDAARSFTIGARAGSFPGAPATRGWTVRWIGIDAPAGVSVDNQPLTMGSGNDHWSYDASSRIVTVTLAARPTNAPLVLTLR